MATSGTASFSVTRDDIIANALRLCGVVGLNGTPDSDQVTETASFLNMIVKARQADGMPLWDTKQAYVLPTTGVTNVSVGGSDNVVSAFTVTTTSAASSSGASTITVTSTTGFANTYAVGIELSSGNMQWTTESGAPSGSTITLATTLTDDVEVGAQVYVYNTSNRILRPLRVISAYNLNYSNTTTPTRYPINLISRDQYFSLGGPYQSSVPNQIYYDPALGTGTLYIYPQFQSGETVIQITYQKPFEDFNSATDTPDFPQEWYLPLTYELAAIMGARNGVPIAERKMLLQEANYYRELALSNGTEEGSLNIQPDWRYFDLGNRGNG